MTNKLLMTCVTWGYSYTKLFKEYTLTTLLASGNLPSWKGKKKDTILRVFAPRENWVSLYKSEQLKAVKKYCEVEWVEINLPPIGQVPYPFVQEHHNEDIKWAEENNYSLMVLSPDLVFTKNVFKELQQAIKDGYEMFLSNGLRIEHNDDDILLKYGGEISGRSGVDYWVKNMHPINQGGFVNAEYFTNYPSNVFYQKSSKVIVARCAHQHPLWIKNPRSPLPKGGMVDGSAYMTKYEDIKDKIYVSTDEKALVMTFTPLDTNWFYKKEGQSPTVEKRKSTLDRFMNAQCPMHHYFYNHKIHLRGSQLTSKDLSAKINPTKENALPVEYLEV